MSLAELSIKRPIFITCIVLLIAAVGFLSFKKLPVDLFPNITFPIVTVNTAYPGAGPQEVETLVSKVLENELGSVPGLKSLRSINKEGVSVVVCEFSLETDVKYAEQQVRDKTANARRKLPLDIKDPVIRRVDPSDQPILLIGVNSTLPKTKLFDIVDEKIKSQIEQVSQVGLVDLVGGEKREIHIELDRKKLRKFEVSANQVVGRLQSAGTNVPAGKIDATSEKETVFRTLGEFKSVGDIKDSIVNFFGNEVPVKIGELGNVADTVEDVRAKTFVNGSDAILMMVFRQSGANTIAVADAVIKRVEKINEQYKNQEGAIKLTVVRDSARWIRANVADVQESIGIGIALTVVVVLLFLGSIRSTLITGLAIPNSLLGAFILISAAGFTINIMSLLALSLSVGLLVDDAIVVRENIFRHVEMGKSSIKASLDGTKEVTLAVVATTLTVIAVFGPIGFLQGVVGQFFKEFGLTICFAMAISLFDAMTMAPMLSAYFAGVREEPKKGLFYYTIGYVLRFFDKFQSFLEDAYEKVLHVTLRIPILVLIAAIAIFVASIFALKNVPKTFLPVSDNGEFLVALDMPPGTTLSAMTQLAQKVDETIRSNKEISVTVLTTGNRDGESNVAEVFAQLVPSKERNKNTNAVKDMVREQLREFDYANPKVKDFDAVGGGQRPFQVNIIGDDLDTLEDYSRKVFERLKVHPALKDPDISFRPGKPEVQVHVNRQAAERYGVSQTSLGSELRTMVEGATPAVFRENGREYNIRVRLKNDQRNLKSGFNQIYIPNINNTLVSLKDVAKLVDATGPATILRQDKGRYIQISADIAADGPGMGAAITDLTKIFNEEMPMPTGMRFRFVGQAENFAELGQSMVLAAGLGILFIFLVLASLYESFVTPFAIMLVLPLAACGAFYGLAITKKSLDLFSMIGCIMLLGIATKNSILLVDYTQQLLKEGFSRKDAIIKAGRTRLRPILMTSLALIAGMLPIAIGLNEASKQRTSMGVAIIGGLVSSTLLTLVVVPAAYSYIDRFRIWSSQLMARLFIPKQTDKGDH